MIRKRSVKCVHRHEDRVGQLGTLLTAASFDGMEILQGNCSFLFI